MVAAQDVGDISKILLYLWVCQDSAVIQIIWHPQYWVNFRNSTERCLLPLFYLYFVVISISLMPDSPFILSISPSCLVLFCLLQRRLLRSRVAVKCWLVPCWKMAGDWRQPADEHSCWADTNFWWGNERGEMTAGCRPTKIKGNATKQKRTFYFYYNDALTQLSPNNSLGSNYGFHQFSWGCGRF